MAALSNQQIQLTLHDAFDLLGFPSQSVINDSGIDEVVRTHFVASSSIAYLFRPFRVVGCIVLTLEMIVDLRCQNAACLAPVSLLVSSVDEHLEPGGFVGHPHGRVRLVLMLAAWTAATLALYDQFVIRQRL